MERLAALVAVEEDERREVGQVESVVEDERRLHASVGQSERRGQLGESGGVAVAVHDGQYADRAEKVPESARATIQSRNSGSLATNSSQNGWNWNQPARS